MKIAVFFISVFVVSCAGSSNEPLPLLVQSGPIQKGLQATPPPEGNPPPAVEYNTEAIENIGDDEDQSPAIKVQPSAVDAQNPINDLEVKPNYNPLTGETVDDPETLQRRPIAVKISNSARVRPQSGLANADIIFEHLTEGGITRFTAIFYSKEGNRVGSIRSGRLIDLEIPLMFDAAFAYSGSSYQIKMMIAASNFFDRVVSPDFGHSGFYRDYSTSTSGRFEDTMFTDTRVIRQALQDRGQDSAPVLQNAMKFQSEAPDGGIPVKSVEIRYLATSAFWLYDPGIGKFLRWSDGVRHLDANTNQQLAFDNIIIVQAEHINTEIIEDSGGSPSIQVKLWGEGPATIFRNGLQYDGIWRREQPGHMLTFYDNSGDALYLTPGKSFFQIVPLAYKKIYIEPS
ncbi:MAG: hypothetical protein BMS9Abin02_0776 [Anaerolineae bacterium]|nr:MAG: hypothetical protein BMS9Abin02_0776 [Anaerolineae bacterium]